MSKGQLTETETLDEKIKRIRKKNEEIEKRRLEVEADKQIAAKLNAMVQLSAPPNEDWPLPRSHSPDEDRLRMPSNSLQDKGKDRTRGNVTFDDEINRPPPDPVYRFLADSERDPLPSKTPDRSRHARGRGHGMIRGRGRDQKGRHEGPASGRGTPVYEAWRAERNRIDEERIRRQRTAQGQWRREWDSQKSEEDWQASRSEKTRDSSNPTPNRSSQPTMQTEPVLRGVVKSRTFPEENKVLLEHGKARIENADISLPIDQMLNVHTLTNENRNVQNHGKSLHVSFVNESSINKALPMASRKPVVGSGRVGLPPLKPQARPPASASNLPSSAAGSGAALPQRRHRESRPQRRRFAAASTTGAATAATVRGRKRAEGPPRGAGRLSSGDGDDSWEDADDHSDADDVQQPTRAEAADEKLVESPVTTDVLIATGVPGNVGETTDGAGELTRDSDGTTDVAGGTAKSQGDLNGSKLETSVNETREKRIEDETLPGLEQIASTSLLPSLEHNDGGNEIDKDDILSSLPETSSVLDESLAKSSKEIAEFNNKSRSDLKMCLDTQSKSVSFISVLETEKLKKSTSDGNVDLYSTKTPLKEMKDFKSNNVGFDATSEVKLNSDEIIFPIEEKNSTSTGNCIEIQDIAETVAEEKSTLTNENLDITDKNVNIENYTTIEKDKIPENIVRNNIEVHTTPCTDSDNIESNYAAKNLNCINETVESSFNKDDNESSHSVLESEVVNAGLYLEDPIRKANANENFLSSPLNEKNIYCNLSMGRKDESTDASVQQEGVKNSTDYCEIKTNVKLLEIKTEVMNACKDEALNIDMKDCEHVANTMKEMNSSIQ